jgi:type VI secretion system protein ImpF
MQQILPIIYKFDYQNNTMDSTLSHNQFYEILRQDLENMLNTHALNIQLPIAKEELNKSILTYGIPDFMSFKLAHEGIKTELCKKIAELIQLHEPRLSEVSVSWQKQTQNNHCLKLQIEATLNLKNSLTNISFNSRLDPLTPKFIIEHH